MAPKSYWARIRLLLYLVVVPGSGALIFRERCVPEPGRDSSARERLAPVAAESAQARAPLYVWRACRLKVGLRVSLPSDHRRSDDP